MLLVSVNARDFIKIGYDNEKRMLCIQSSKVSKRFYYDVPNEVYAELFNSKDKDSYFKKNIQFKYKSN